MRRPIVDVKEIGERNFHWPQTSFYSIEDYKSANDVILVFGEEPSMRWKTYADNIANTLLDIFAVDKSEKKTVYDWVVSKKCNDV